jgi:hypothetical protein
MYIFVCIYIYVCTYISPSYRYIRALVHGCIFGCACKDLDALLTPWHIWDLRGHLNRALPSTGHGGAPTLVRRVDRSPTGRLSQQPLQPTGFTTRTSKSRNPALAGGRASTAARSPILAALRSSPPSTSPAAASTGDTDSPEAGAGGGRTTGRAALWSATAGSTCRRGVVPLDLQAAHRMAPPLPLRRCARAAAAGSPCGCRQRLASRAGPSARPAPNIHEGSATSANQAAGHLVSRNQHRGRTHRNRCVERAPAAVPPSHLARSQPAQPTRYRASRHR